MNQTSGQLTFQSGLLVLHCVDMQTLLATVHYWRGAVACSNYFQIAVGPPHSSAGVPGHPLLRGWQYFPVFTNYFFLVRLFATFYLSYSAALHVHQCI